MKVTAVVASVATVGLWLCTPPARAQAIQEMVRRSTPHPRSELKPGLTQCLTPAQWAAVDTRRAKEAADKEAHRPAVRLLSQKEMAAVHGRGIYRNKYLSGTMPWHRSLRDANLCTGNLFKSFTDIQVQGAKGAGLALQRTYNSNDSHIGPFGIGWTHAYDIRMENDPGPDQPDFDPAPPNAEGDTNYGTRQDFFGHKHKYHCDADGLWSPPPYLFDELSSNYNAFLVNGPLSITDDTDKGMDGTVKHYIANGPNGVRSCDYIQDRYGNQTVLTYDPSITLPDGTNPLSTATDPSGRELVFHNANLGTVGSPVWRVVQVDGPQYSVVYGYGADGNVSSVTLDAANPAPGVTGVVGAAPHLARTTTYGYTSVNDGNGNTESGLLSSITDPLGAVEGGHTLTYTYTLTFPDGTGQQVPTATNSVWVGTITEPAGIDPTTHQQRTQTWTLDALIYNSASGNTLSTQVTGTAFPNGFLRLNTDTQLRAVVTGPGLTQSQQYYFVYLTQYDSANNVTSANATLPQYSSGQYTYCNVSNYGPHGNVLQHWYGPGYAAPPSAPPGGTPYDQTVYDNASQYFQKQSVTDMNGHTSTLGVGTDTAGNVGDPDPNIGDRGQVLWVKDALYGDGTLNPTGTRFQYNA
jgi:hypothetical protein